MNPGHIAVIVLALSVSQAPSADIEVAITEGTSRAAVTASAEPDVSGPPHAAIPARPLKSDDTPTCEWFRIRAWLEGDGVRVIVFAVNRSPEGDQESQLAAYLLQAGDSVEVTETRSHRARPVRLVVPRGGNLD